MTTTAPTDPVPPRWRRWVGSPRTRMWLLYAPLCVCTSVLAISTWDVRAHGAGAVSKSSDQAVLIWLVGLLAIVLLGWRRRFPVPVAVATAFVPLVLPLDPTPALIAFGSLAVRRLDRVTAMVGGLTLLATGVPTWRDAQGWSRASSFWHFVSSSDKNLHAAREPLSWWVVLVITALCCAITVAIALFLRERDQRRRHVEVHRTQKAVVETLSDEVARRAERERLAQEVHDALGHRLSLLSLHAGALEVVSGDDPRTAQSAALVRANAQQSMADLRHLLAMLRQPDAPDVAAAVPTLGEVGALVDETLATGTTVVSTVQLEAVARLDETTSRSAFRITQELLTNARKHAPGIGVRVRVFASPSVGVEIEVANHVPQAVAGVEGAAGVEPGNGLRGIAARVEQLGGQWHCWVDEHQVFRAAAHLPWVWASADGAEVGDSGPAATAIGAATAYARRVGPQGPQGPHEGREGDAP